MLLSQMVVGILTSCWAVILISVVLITWMRYQSGRSIPQSGTQLERLVQDLSLALERLPEGVTQGEQIALSGLYVKSAEWWVDNHGNSGYRVMVGGCSPQRNYLREHLQLILRDRGWPGIQVRVERA